MSFEERQTRLEAFVDALCHNFFTFRRILSQAAVDACHAILYALRDGELEKAREAAKSHAEAWALWARSQGAAA